jgi:tetratricopeptide (TPR) repeat protein
MTNGLSQQPTRIFVSHSSKDSDFGVRLTEDLRRVLGNETAVWYDARGGLHGGDLWWRKIVDELTARNVFIVVLSPDALASQWVNAEIDLAWRQRLSKVDKLIIPILYRQCEVRADLDLLQIIKFLPPKSYETAFDELLIALGLPTDEKTSSSADPAATSNVAADHESTFVRQMTPQIETAFAEQDWPVVIRKVNLLIRRAPGAISAAIYRMQAIALREEGQLQPAQDALDIALALVSNREQRLTILRDYADLLASQKQWNEVLHYAREALRLAPNDAYWLTVRQQAQKQAAPLKPPNPAAQPTIQAPPQQSAPPVPQKTKEQWLTESFAHYEARRYEEARKACEHALQLDPKFAYAHNTKGLAFYSLKRYTEALNALEQAIQFSPNEPTAHYGKGRVLERLQRYQEALQAYEQVIRLDSGYEEARADKANVLKRLGRSG